MAVLSKISSREVPMALLFTSAISVVFVLFVEPDRTYLALAADVWPVVLLGGVSGIDGQRDAGDASS